MNRAIPAIIYWTFWISLGCAIGLTLRTLTAQNLSSINCLPAALTSGQSSTCTVQLISPAVNAQQVNLTSGSPVFAVPPNVTVPSGTLSTTFTAIAGQVVAATTVTISGSLPGVATVVIVSPIPATPPAYTLSFSTYFGGAGNDWIRDVATDSQGNIYVTGGSGSSNFPTTPGAYDTTFNGNVDVFVAKFTSNGLLVCSTLLGGPNYDRAYAIEVDGGGIYVGGRAGVAYPTTLAAPQPSFAGDNSPNSAYGQQDGFITKLSLDCSQVLWSTFIGDTGLGFLRDIALDGVGGVYGVLSDVTGTIPLVGAGMYQSAKPGARDGGIVKVSTAGVFQWATYFGAPGDNGTNPSVRADATGVYMIASASTAGMPVTMGPLYGGGLDMHLAKLSPDGKTLLFGRYIGGTGGDWCETHCLALGPQGTIIAAFTSGSSGMGTVGAYDTTYNGSCSGSCGNYGLDGLVVKLDSAGTILAATYFGGSNGDGLEGVGVDAAGNVYIGGASYSTNLPMVGGSYQTTNKGQGDMFVAKFNPNLSQLLYSSYAGGTGEDFSRSLHVDQSGTIYLGGQSTGSYNAWMVNSYKSVNAGGTDGVLLKFAP